MPSLPSGRRKKTPRSKTQYTKKGKPDLRYREAFYGWNPEHAALYNTARWEKIRKIVLGRAPMCPICVHMDKLEPAVDVDHVVAHKGDTHLFHSLENLWALCKPHHFQKTAAEANGTFYESKKEWLNHIISMNKE